jgi:hypothetical protein
MLLMPGVVVAHGASGHFSRFSLKLVKPKGTALAADAV